MIVVLVDTTHDAHLLHRVYEGLEDIKLMVNPSKAEVIKVLEDNPTETLLAMGHGSPSGLFGVKWSENVIDKSMVPLLETRMMIGIWCHANRFAEMNPSVNGFFTSMFISNEGEASCFGYKAKDEDVLSEVTLFCERVNKLIKEDVPMKEWVGKIYEQGDLTKDFVSFNYKGLKYYNKRTIVEYDEFRDKIVVWD